MATQNHRFQIPPDFVLIPRRRVAVQATFFSQPPSIGGVCVRERERLEVCVCMWV